MQHMVREAEAPRDDRNFRSKRAGAGGAIALSRKDKRKQDRKLKKMRKQAFSQRKAVRAV